MAAPSALPPHLLRVSDERLATISYHGLSHADRLELERLLSTCVVRSGGRPQEEAAVHYFQAYCVDHAGAPSAEEAATTPAPLYDRLLEEPLPRSARPPPRPSRRPGGFSGRYFDALEPPAGTPGVLSPELRALLGIGPLDPPPYLRRMQQLGYPPGYVGVPSAAAGGDELLAWHAEPGLPPAAEGADGPAVARFDYPGVNVPPPVGSDPAAWNWRGPLRRPPPG